MASGDEFFHDTAVENTGALQPGGDDSDDEDDRQVVVQSIDRSSTLPQIDTDEREHWVSCYYCGFRFPGDGVIHKGTSEHPKWVDKPCHASSRWYDKAIVSHGEVPADIKRLQKKKYAANVFRFRVVHPSDPEEVKNACKLQHNQQRIDEMWVFRKRNMAKKRQLVWMRCGFSRSVSSSVTM